MADSLPATRPRVRWHVAGWCALVAYSAAHFLYSAVLSAWKILGGDVLSAFPSVLTLRVSQAWPPLARDWITSGMVWNGPMGWNYGPALHVLTLPFAVASTQAQAMHLMLVADCALVAATFWLWVRLLCPGRPRTVVWVGILCVWLNHFPLIEALAGREIELLELFLITLAVWALRQEREGLAGAAVGMAAMTKFLPAIFIPYLFVKGYRRAGWAATLTAASIALIAQPLLGWQRSVTLSIANAEQAGTYDLVPTAYSNQALTNVLHKTFTAFNIDDPRPPTLYPDLLRIVGNGLSLAVLLATAWFVVRWRRSRLIELECALLAIIMCLVVPHANTYYFVFLLPALSIGVAALQQRPAAVGVPAKVALAGAIALSGFLLPMGVYEKVTRTPGVLVARVLQGWSLPAYGAILAAALMLELHRVSRERPDQQRPSTWSGRASHQPTAFFAWM